MDKALACLCEEALAWFGVKRHWPDLIEEALAWVWYCHNVLDKRHWPALDYNVFAEALLVWYVRAEVFFTAWLFRRFIFSIISFVFSSQLFVSDHGWRCISVSVKPDFGELISTLLKSKASSTEKRYKRKILKFIDYCNFSGVRPVPPFPVTFLVAYRFKVYKRSSSYASLVMTHAALKWFHSFSLSSGANPLDNSICHNSICHNWRLLGVISQLVLRRRLYPLRLLRVLLISLLVLLLVLRTCV